MEVDNIVLYGMAIGAGGFAYAGGRLLRPAVEHVSLEPMIGGAVLIYIGGLVMGLGIAMAVDNG